MALASAALTWSKRDNRSEAWMTAVLIGVSMWAGGHLLLVSAESYSVKYALIVVTYPASTVLPVTMFVFTLHYTGRKALLTTPRIAALFAIPVTAFVVALTNDTHGLFFVAPHLDVAGSYTRLEYGWGPLIYVYGAGTHSIALCYVYMLFLKFVRSRNIYRKMSFILLVTAGTMLAANVYTILGFSPFPHMLLLPFTFLFFGIVAVLSTISTRFVQLTPIDRVLSTFSSLFVSLVPLARDIVIEEIDSGVIVLDRDNRIVDINSMGKRIVVSRRDRIVGRKLTDVVDEELFVTHGPELLDPDTTGRFESVWIEAADGEPRCYDITIDRISSTVSHSSDARVALIHDITAQQRRKRELEEKNERLDDFASIVSHDLRNPLNVTAGYVDLIDDEIDDEPVNEYVEGARSSIERMDEIIENVLVLARQGQAIEQRQELVIADLVRRAWENVDTLGADFECRFDDSSTIEADRASVLRVFENLFRNAVEHGSTSPGSQARQDAGRANSSEPSVTDAPEDAVEHGDEDAPARGADELTVRVGPLESGDGIHLEDDGTGIPEERRDNVFDHAYTTVEDGTGYGLSIVRDIVEAHEWAIDVTESDEGGARFEITGVVVRDRDVETTASSSSS